jgi:hypothetical protein
MRTVARGSYDKKWQLRDVLGIGVVTRTPKINRESQQNHNKTHNARPLESSSGARRFAHDHFGRNSGQQLIEHPEPFDHFR